MRWSVWLVMAAMVFFAGTSAEAQSYRQNSGVQKVSAQAGKKVVHNKSKRKVSVAQANAAKAHHKRRIAKSTHNRTAKAASARTARVARAARTANAGEAAYQRSSVTSDSTWQRSASVAGAGPRPRAWCGWWMRTQRGGGPELNVAWNWSRWGRPTTPQVGAVVVWRRHVGEIVGQASNGQWLIRSGNDGGQVRTRPWNIRGAVFRI
ncbi:MAG: hypothetical protein ACOYLQ_05735 [Hyphomicrobiaceae bacterium]